MFERGDICRPPDPDFPKNHHMHGSRGVPYFCWMIHSICSPPGFWGGTHFSGSPPEVPRMGGKQKYFSGSPPEVFILGGNSQIFCFEMPPNPQNFPPAAGKSLPPQTMRGNFQQKTGSPPIVGGNFPPQTSQDWRETSPPDLSGLGGNFTDFF